jgi:CRP-like cAMP-binding protein
MFFLLFCNFVEDFGLSVFLFTEYKINRTNASNCSGFEKMVILFCNYCIEALCKCTYKFIQSMIISSFQKHFTALKSGFDVLSDIIQGEFPNEVKYKKKEVLLKQGAPITHILLLEEGIVKICKENANGKTNILEIVKQNDFIGIQSALSSQLYEFSAIVLSPVTVRFIPVEVFFQVLCSNADFNSYILFEMSVRSLGIINRLVHINNKQLPGRVADLLIYFYRLNNEHESFDLLLSRSELAQFAGTTKESMIRTLMEFKNDRIIDLDGNQVTINSMEIIQTLSRLG